jgi:hypothetical protein
MLNINEQELKDAIAQKAADEILREDNDLNGMIAKEVKTRLDRIFIDRANAQIEAAIDQAVQTAFDREYQRVTSWGEADGPKTSIRAQIDKVINGYWSEQVNAKTGKPNDGYGDKVTRAEYLVTQMCAKDFSAQMRQDALNITGALKDGLRNQMALVMDETLNGLFKVKSLQDQGKVEKPY